MIELLKNRSILNVSGADALKFLQSMTTNDLINNKYSYNYLLSPQGRYLYDFFVYKISNEELIIDIHSSCVESLIQKLNLYKLRRDIDIKYISSDYCLLYSKSKIDFNDDIIFSCRDPRFSKLGFRSLVKTAYAKTLEGIFDDLYIQDKYEFTIPDGVNDLIYERSVPSHFGGEELSAISFSKGCYVGQEVISRAKYQGVIRKKLFKIKSSTKIAFHELGAEITDIKGEKIGIFCSSYNNLGIVLLNEEKYLVLDGKNAIIGLDEVSVTIPEWRL